MSAAAEPAAPAAVDGAFRTADTRAVLITGNHDTAASGKGSSGDGGGVGILPGIGGIDEDTALRSGGVLSAATPSADASLTIPVPVPSESIR